MNMPPEAVLFMFVMPLAFGVRIIFMGLEISRLNSEIAELKATVKQLETIKAATVI